MRRSAAMAVPCLLLMLLAGCGGGGGSNFTTNTSGSSSGGSTGGSGSGGMNGTGGTLLITTASLPDGLTGKAYTSSIATTGGNGRLTFSLSAGSFFPAGLAMDPGTGSIHGTVTNAVFGDVTFMVTDSGSPQQVALKTVRMTFHWAMSVVTNLPVPAGHTNVPYKIPYYCDSSNGTVNWTVSTGQVPPGLSLTNLNSTEADLVGSPTQPGTYNFTVQVVDSSTPPQTATYPTTITVDNKVAISTVTLPVPFANESYSQTVAAVNGTPPYHWSAQLPSFFHIDANSGTISGVALGSNTGATVTVTDSSSPAQTASQSYSWLILPRLGVNGGNLQDAHVGNGYTTYLSGVGGQGNVAWSLVSGNLPPGISLQGQYGILTGTPTQLGTYVFTMQLQDGSNPPQVAQGQFTLNVKPAALTFQTSLPQRIPINVPFDGMQVVSGGTPPLTFSISQGSLPPGLTLDSSTGRLNGTPTTLGYFGFRIEVVDASTPVQRDSNVLGMEVGPALGRNDTPSNATVLPANAGFGASISPLLDPPDGTMLSPDNDYYRITGVGGAIIKVNVSGNSSALDPVLEFVDANGARLNGCRTPGDVSSNFNSPCLNDDVSYASRDSQLEYRVPGTSDQKTSIYAHVLDWRGDARPDMWYGISVQGSYVPIVFKTPAVLPPLAANSYYYQSLQVHGGTGQMTGTITAGQLPPGISMGGGSTFINNDGTGDWTAILTGGATTPGDYAFTLSIKDSGTPAETVTQQFTIHVFPAIQVAPIPDQALKVGQITTYQAVGSGGITPYFWNVTGWGDVSIDQNTGLITFHPTTAGQFMFAVTIIGNGGGTQWMMENVNVTVNP